jgi:hypothetical protein
MKNDGKKKSLVFADQSHGTYDTRLEYGRALCASKPAHFDANDTKTLEAVRRELPTAKQKVDSTVAIPSKEDKLSQLQKKMSVTSKKKRKAKSTMDADGGNFAGATNSKKEKCEPSVEAEKPVGVSSAPDCLQGLLGNYGSSSDSD